ncbi:DNA primase [Streptomyces avermitilis]|uniref:DNA primase n=1 Tax=Streptomyces avermitilis TaxID=33903 RepID=UPI0033D36430
MNRIGLGLAIGAGYVLGRTKKMKLAFAVGTMVAGKRLNLTPRALADLVSQQLQNNPQFKEIGDELRQDLRGVGKAASGALLERQIEGLADRLHGRTAQVRDQLAGVAPDVPGLDDDERDEEDGRDERDEADEPEERDEADEPEERDRGSRGDEDRPRRSTPAKKTAAKKGPAKKAPVKKTATGTAGAKKAATKAPAKKTAAAKSSARRVTRTRSRERGGDDE